MARILPPPKKEALAGVPRKVLVVQPKVEKAEPVRQPDLKPVAKMQSSRLQGAAQKLGPVRRLRQAVV